ncbi:hypothetical protein GGI23_002813 [Coemansia sp. RSA 2559]|nr:hypothetical protein GGI23_002813 [Coemansia sp. RSA 2559]KAJ2860031.1 hypothetical protein GGI22_002828 [Coemansia erecta]
MQLMIERCQKKSLQATDAEVKDNNAHSVSNVLAKEYPSLVTWKLTAQDQTKLDITLSTTKGALASIKALVRDLNTNHEAIQNVRELVLDIDTRGSAFGSWALFRSHKDAKLMARKVAEMLPLLTKLVLTLNGKDRNAWMFVKTLINLKMEILMSLTIKTYNTIPCTGMWFLPKTVFKVSRGK